MMRSTMWSCSGDGPLVGQPAAEEMALWLAVRWALDRGEDDSEMFDFDGLPPMVSVSTGTRSWSS